MILVCNELHTDDVGNRQDFLMKKCSTCAAFSGAQTKEALDMRQAC